MLLKCVIYTTAVSTESSRDSGPFYPATVSIKPALTYFTVGNLCFHLSVCSVTILRVSLLFSHNVQCLNVFLFFLIFMCHIFPSVSKSGNDEWFLCVLCLIWRHLMHQPGQDKTTSVNHRFNKDVILGYWFPSHCSYWLCKMQGPISGACTQLVNLWLHTNQTTVAHALQKQFSSQSLKHPVCNSFAAHSTPTQVINDAAAE